jgi:hypothetical protein
MNRQCPGVGTGLVMDLRWARTPRPHTVTEWAAAVDEEMLRLPRLAINSLCEGKTAQQDGPFDTASMCQIRSPLHVEYLHLCDASIDIKEQVEGRSENLGIAWTRRWEGEGSAHSMGRPDLRTRMSARRRM